MEPMSSNPQTQIELGVIIGDVLGDLAFLVGDDEPLHPCEDAAWNECEIEYRGPIQARLRCWCTQAFANQLAANLLGIDENDDQANTSSDDALQEFMNVVCGQLVTAWHGTEPVFNLSIPKVDRNATAPDGTTFGPPHACRLSVNNELFYCRWELLP